jgi:hypothetical protein
MVRESSDNPLSGYVDGIASDGKPIPKPGDLLGFSARDWSGTLINLASWGIPAWGLSHVAIVAHNPCYPTLRGPCLWESTTLCSVPCLVAKRPVAGVQAHTIHSRVSGYRGRVWHYPLAVPLEESDAAALSGYCLGHAGWTYDTIGAFRSGGFGWLESRFRPENLASLFCSEFVAACYRRVGVWRTAHCSRWNPNHLVRSLRHAEILGKPWRMK